jgi:flavin-dependent dehydrogenase
MDHQLLERAKSVGVTVLEEAHASRLVCDGPEVRGIRVKTSDGARDYRSRLTIDATGRTRSLARQLDPPRANRRGHTNSLVAFKAHLENARVAAGACEIYFYPRGYGGLSAVEGGVSNLCFIVAGSDVRRYGSDPEVVMREVVMKNSRAAHTLAEARARTPWLSVSLETFGRRTLAPAAGILTVGDAAAFIDPFTGSGMLMALESGHVAAAVVTRHLDRLGHDGAFASMANDYAAEYQRRFDSRLRVASLLRRAAFVPHLAEAAILFFGTSSRLRRKLARATRHSSSREVTAPGS